MIYLGKHYRNYHLFLISRIGLALQISDPIKTVEFALERRADKLATLTNISSSVFIRYRGDGH